MATLEEQRRASGQRIEAERRAIGNRMIEERTGKSVANDINRLTTPPRQRKTLRTLQPVGGLPASRGRADYKAPVTTATASGLASPLNEKTKSVDVGGEMQAVADRAFHDLTSYIYSDSGLLVVELRPLKKMTMIDANGDEHAFNFAQPVAP